VDEKNMKHNSGKVLEAYMKMLLDGSAFSNWKNKPDRNTRRSLVESILDYKPFSVDFDINKIEKVISEAKNESELKRMLYDMEIKEDDFKV
jgi:hypothetical protein